MKNITAKMGKIKSSPAMKALVKGIKALDTKNKVPIKKLRAKSNVNLKTNRAISGKINTSTPQKIAKDIKSNPLQAMAGQESSVFNSNPLK